MRNLSILVLSLGLPALSAAAAAAQAPMSDAQFERLLSSKGVVFRNIADIQKQMRAIDEKLDEIGLEQARRVRNFRAYCLAVGADEKLDLSADLAAIPDAELADVGAVLDGSSRDHNAYRAEFEEAYPGVLAFVTGPLGRMPLLEANARAGTVEFTDVGENVIEGLQGIGQDELEAREQKKQLARLKADLSSWEKRLK